jgi:TolB-like protein/Tfp pilus assembly protein PilF
MSLIHELKRRNVFRVAAAYVVSAWLIIQVVEVVFPVYGFSDATIRFVISALAVGLIPVLILAWAFELTPEGFRKERDIDGSRSDSPQAGKKLDRIIMVLLAVALGYFAFDKFVMSESREAEIAKVARQAGRTDAVVESYGELSIAVLPFVDMSPGKDQEYMSDGIAEELLNLLTRIPELRVISRSSAFSFKGKDIDLPTMAQKLNAAYILEGSVRTAGDQVRITAQLIEARSDTHRWSKTYDRKLENIFQIQDEIAAQVVEELRITLLSDMPRSQRVDEEAYTLVLQARYFWYRRAPGDAEQALALYQRALEIDPSYAPAWAGLSIAYIVAANAGSIDRETAVAKAHEAAVKAVALDPNLADAHVRMGQSLGRQGDRPGQLTEFERAYELDPNNPLALGGMADVLRRRERLDEAIEFQETAESVDPLSAIWPAGKASYLLDAGRFDEAEVAIDRAFELNLNTRQYGEKMAELSILRGEYAKALELLNTLPETGQNLVGIAVAYHGVGRHEESDNALAKMQGLSDDPDGPWRAYGTAAVYARRGEHDKAFEQLEKISGIGRWRILYETFFTVLHDDPRWQPYIDTMEPEL